MQYITGMLLLRQPKKAYLNVHNIHKFQASIWHGQKFRKSMDRYAYQNGLKYRTKINAH